MKRFSILFAVAIAVTALIAAPASARTIKIRASVKQKAAHRVVFTIHTVPNASIRVVVYRGRHAIAHLHAHRSARSRYMYYSTWSGSRVQKGTFHYRIIGKRRHYRRHDKRGKIRVWAPKYHAPTPTPTTAPAVVSPAPVATVFNTNNSGRWIGLWVPGSPQDMAPLEAAESVTGVHTKVVHFYVADSESFPRSRCEAVDQHESIPLVTLEFWSIGSTGLSAITNGSKDAYIKKFADDAKSYGKEVWVRPLHEMNGNWYPWGGTVGSNSASKLVSAWKHIHGIFAAEGATNVKFVWSPNNDSVPSGSGNAISAYWPGDAYVDYAALDGYNSGTTQSWSSWRPFASVFGASYATVAGLTSKPIFIAETSSVERGGSKAAWISDMFKVIPSQFPRVVGVCWFNENKTYDWRIESSSTSASAFRAGATKGF